MRTHTNNLNINREITRAAEVTNILHFLAIVSWGRWWLKSAEDITRLGITSQHDLGIIIDHFQSESLVLIWFREACGLKGNECYGVEQMV